MTEVVVYGDYWIRSLGDERIIVCSTSMREREITKPKIPYWTNEKATERKDNKHELTKETEGKGTHHRSNRKWLEN